MINRTLQVKLPGVLSRIGTVSAGVPQGSVISPSLFNVYISDIQDYIPSEIPVTMCKYADDCSQHEFVPNGSNDKMQEAVNHLKDWATNNKMELNARKTKDMWISFKRSGRAPPPINIGGTIIERVTKFKLLGVTVQNDLKWNAHVSTIVKKASKRIYFVRACRKANLPSNIGLTTYCTKIRPLLEYAAPIRGGRPCYLKEDIERVQKRCLDIIGVSSNIIEPLESRRDKITCKEYNNIRDSKNHPYRFVCDMVNHKYNLRTVSNPLLAPISNTDRHKQSFIPRAAWLDFFN